MSERLLGIGKQNVESLLVGFIKLYIAFSSVITVSILWYWMISLCFEELMMGPIVLCWWSSNIQDMYNYPRQRRFYSRHLVFFCRPE